MPVSFEAKIALGFFENISIDQAREKCRQINKVNSKEKEQIRKAGQRLQSIQSLDSILFPENLIKEFENKIKDDNFGSEKHLRKIMSHFIFVQKMIRKLNLSPPQYKEEQKRIYKYFSKEQISFSYSSRIISLLNRWGKFWAKYSGQFYEDVDIPRGREKEAIIENQQNKKGTNTKLGVRAESLPLSPSILSDKKKYLSEENYNWLFISVWFGLRPYEINSLKKEDKYRIEFNVRHKVFVLKVYQSKLMSISRDKRWKSIPVIFEEQKSALEIIKSGHFKQPIYKVMNKCFGGITLYGGRKGFVDLMLERKQKLEDISMWLGHKDISTTWLHYKNKDEVRFSKVENE